MQLCTKLNDVLKFSNQNLLYLYMQKIRKYEWGENVAQWFKEIIGLGYLGDQRETFTCSYDDLEVMSQLLTRVDSYIYELKKEEQIKESLLSGAKVNAESWKKAKEKQVQKLVEVKHHSDINTQFYLKIIESQKENLQNSKQSSEDNSKLQQQNQQLSQRVKNLVQQVQNYKQQHDLLRAQLESKKKEEQEYSQSIKWYSKIYENLHFKKGLKLEKKNMKMDRAISQLSGRQSHPQLQKT